MNQIKYLDFDLLIERAEEGYTARVLNSPAGQGSASFGLPFSELELENFLLRVGRTRRGVRRLESPEMEAAKDFGGRLFTTVFDDEVRACLRSSLDEASRQGAGLRIRLRLTGAPEITDVPWEYLYNPSLNRFLSLSVETPLVRYLDLPERIQPLAVKPPLRILVMISSPSNQPPLDVEEEWARLKEALRDLEQRGLVTLEKLEQATLYALQRQLRRGGYHIFHFIGHGAFDQHTQDGVLLMEDEAGIGRPVSGQDLGMLLHDERTLRLAILNACEGARTSRSDPFAGVAQSLVQQGVPAVIAMQFEITDEAAITLAHEFYAALADGYPVDAALAEARKAIFAQGNDVEWGKPVLYLRAPDGQIFEIEPLSKEEQESAQAIAVSPSEQKPRQEADERTLSKQRIAWAPWMTIVAALSILILVVGGGYLVARSLIPHPAESFSTPTVEPSLAPTTAPSPTPKVTPSPTLTSTPVETPIPTCPAVSGPLASTWQANQDKLGCASNIIGWSDTIQMAQETFQYGQMFWRADSKTILILYEPGNLQGVGTWSEQPDKWDERNPCCSCAEAMAVLSPDVALDCPCMPKRGFGMVWCENQNVRTGLGKALTKERELSGLAQDFDNGAILRTDAGDTYVLYDDDTWVVVPDADAAMAHQQAGASALNQKALDLAIAELTLALRLNPDDVYTLYLRALAYDESGKDVEAIGDYSGVIERDPSYTAAYLERGLLYANVMDDCEKAIPDLEHYLESTDKSEQFEKYAREALRKCGR